MGTWCFRDGSDTKNYEIKREGGRIFFHQNDAHGELVVDGEWLVAKLVAKGVASGTIRLKEVGGKITSNYKPEGKETWQKDVASTRSQQVVNVFAPWRHCAVIPAPSSLCQHCTVITS